MTGTAFPLAWPPTIPRSKSHERGQFKALPAALKSVEASLRLFGSDSRKPLAGVVISSNVTLGVMQAADSGVAVWFTWDVLQVCITVDRYETVEGNLQAIHHIIEVRRVELRHGTVSLVRASFQGFKALPAPYWFYDMRPELPAWMPPIGRSASTEPRGPTAGKDLSAVLRICLPDNGRRRNPTLALSFGERLVYFGT